MRKYEALEVCGRVPTFPSPDREILEVDFRIKFQLTLVLGWQF
jgi:hypothetical protein